MVLIRSALFNAWLSGLRDKKGRALIAKRLERWAAGNPGDVEPVGEGVSELRIHFGPGYRVYIARRGETTYILCGGDKKSQAADIRTAKEMAEDL
jgi:putative addiction module killer protein